MNELEFESQRKTHFKTIEKCYEVGDISKARYIALCIEASKEREIEKLLTVLKW